MTVKLIPHKPDNIVGLEIDGWIEEEDINRVIQLIEERTNQGKKLRIYAEVNNWSGISLRAFIKDIKFSFQHFKDFEKEVIVSDYKWLEGLSAWGNTVFSSIEVKHFTLDQKEQALALILH